MPLGESQQRYAYLRSVGWVNLEMSLPAWVDTLALSTTLELLHGHGTNVL